MVIFIRIRRSTKLEYTSSSLDDESLIYCCCHMHKDHTVMMQALLWIRIVVVDDIKKFLSNELELKIHSADTWMTTQRKFTSC